MTPTDPALAPIRDKVLAGERLTFADGLVLEASRDLFTLGELANHVREAKNGTVTYYNVNQHLNPTNVCVYRCTFCSFRSDLKGPNAFVMTDEQILARAREATKARRSCTSSAGSTTNSRTSGISASSGRSTASSRPCT